MGDPRAHPTLLPTFPLCHTKAGLCPAALSPTTCGISPRGISPRPDRTGFCFAVIVSAWILRHRTGRFGIGVTGMLLHARTLASSPLQLLLALAEKSFPFWELPRGLWCSDSTQVQAAGTDPHRGSPQPRSSLLWLFLCEPLRAPADPGFVCN